MLFYGSWHSTWTEHILTKYRTKQRSTTSYTLRSKTMDALIKADFVYYLNYTHAFAFCQYDTIGFPSPLTLFPVLKFPHVEKPYFVVPDEGEMTRANLRWGKTDSRDASRLVTVRQTPILEAVFGEGSGWKLINGFILYSMAVCTVLADTHQHKQPTHSSSVRCWLCLMADSCWLKKTAHALSPSNNSVRMWAH